MKKFYSRIIPLAIGIVFFSTNIFAATNWQKEKILPADKAIGRPACVLNQTIIVRFKPQAVQNLTGKNSSEKKFLEKFSSMIGKAEAQEMLFRPEMSIAREIKNSRGTALLSTEKISSIQKAEEPLLRTAIVHYEEKISPEKFCEKILRENPNVEHAEPYYVPRLLGAKFTPNDPEISSQYHLAQIKAFEAWDIYQGDSNVVIAISDGGIDQDHEDLRDNIWTNAAEIPNNNIDDDANGYVDDYRGYNLSWLEDGRNGGDTRNSGGGGSHGTAVAGLAGAKFNNATGVTGTGGKSKIFPIKIAPYGTEDLRYDYQSVIYAGKMQFKVLNCTWGAVAPSSPIYQSVIDYAVSRGVAVVFAGGNEDNSLETVFPAGYRGVLGVGEVTSSEQLSYASSLGEQIHIMAPGGNSYSTQNGGGYTSLGNGTSYAAPVVSGVVAMIRGKYPELTPIQALEFARQSVDFIADKTPQYELFIPGRINMLKAMTNAPFTTPSIRPTGLETFRTDGKPSARFRIGDTVSVRIPAKNYLGAGKNLQFRLSSTSPFDNVSLIDSTASEPVVATGAEFAITLFKALVNSGSSDPVLFRVDISGEGENGAEYEDFFLIAFTPASGMTTIANDSIAFSVGDAGGFGREYYSKKQHPGLGFFYGLQSEFIWKGGFFAAQSPEVAPSAVNSEGISQSDFTPKKFFSAPEDNLGIITDDSAGSNRIGLEIEQFYYFPSQNSSVAKAQVTIKNISGKILQDISAGYYIDWDAGASGTDDKVEIFPEAIPAGLGSASNSGYIVQSVSNPSPLFGGAIMSNETGAVAQFAGFPNSSVFDDGEGFSASDRFSLLNSGIQTSGGEAADIGVAIGIKFSGQWQPNEEKSFTMYFGAAKSRTELKHKLQKAIDSTVNSVEENFSSEGIFVSPNPANERLQIGITVRSGEKFTLKIISSLSEEIFSLEKNFSESGQLLLPVETKNFAPGVYVVQIKTREKILSQKFVIVR